MSLLIKRDDKNAKGINKKAVKNATHEEYKNTNDTNNEFPKMDVMTKIDSKIYQRFFVWSIHLF